MEETVKEEVVVEKNTSMLDSAIAGYNYNFEKEANARDNALSHSDTVGAIAGALAKAQGAMKNAGKASEGYGYSYADIGANFDAVRKPLSDNSIAILHGHSVKNTEKPVVFTTVMIAHESGEWFRSTIEIPLTIMKGLSISQSIGVIATYSRRYLLQAITGLASEDTDASIK